MAEVFGEAEVILRARLDALEADLRQGETLIMQQTDRVARAQIEAYREVGQAHAEGETSALDVAQTGLLAYMTWQRIGTVVSLVRAGLMLIPAVAMAASAAMVASAVAAVVAVGLIQNKILETQRAAADMIEAFRGLDGTQQKALEFSDALARIPLVGRAASQVFEMMSSDAGKSTEAWTRLVAKVEDGEVKVGLLGRAINGLANFSAPGIVLRMLGFDLDLVGQIDDANQKIREMNALLEQQQRFQGVAGQIGYGAQAGLQAAQRAAQMAQVDGIETVRLEQRFATEDAIKGYHDRVRELNKMHSQERQAIEDLHEAGEINHEERMRRERNAARLSEQITANQKIALDAELDAIRRNAAARELAMQRELEAQERQRRIAREEREASIESNTEAVGFEIAGDPFQAERVRNEAERQRAIRDEYAKGSDLLIDDINAFYDARAELINKREAEQVQNDKENADRRAQQAADAAARKAEAESNAEFRTMQDNERLRSQILQARMRSEGQLLEAQQEAIRQRAQETIDQMERAGNEQGAMLARQLRDLQLNEAEADFGNKQASLRSQEFQQVSASRTSTEGVGSNRMVLEELRIAREQLETQKGIRDELRNPRPAVAQ